MNKILIPFLLLLLGHSITAQTYVRYNHVGYTPSRDKRVIVMSENDLGDQPWQLIDSLKQVVLSGKIGLSKAQKSAHTPLDFNYEIDLSSVKTIGNYTLICAETKTPISIKTHAYDFIPKDVLRYIRVHRSGTKECLDHKASHKGDRSCKVMRSTGDNSVWEIDTATKKVNMKGGWYDAGDYIKFTLTSAYACYLILRSYEAYPELFDYKVHSASELNDILDEALHGLEYLSKTLPDPKTFIIQVGGHEDHNQGVRLPEFDELNGFRECYAAHSPTQMGYTAAALALGSKIFKDIPEYQEHAKRYEEKAKAIYDQMIKEEHIAWVQSGWENFYKDDSPYDNQALAAIELYNLTGERNYLTKAKELAHLAKSAYWVSWGSAHMIVHNRIYAKDKELFEYLETDLNTFEGISQQHGNIWGVPHKYTWATLYSFLGVANGAMLFQESTKLKKRFNEIPLDVLDYSLGMNNWGIAMVASEKIPNSVENIYSQIYRLKPKLYPTGAIAEGPGDMATHRSLKQYFQIDEDNPFDKFNTSAVVFYDDETDFQTMETTIGGLADGLFFYTLIAKKYAK